VNHTPVLALLFLCACGPEAPGWVRVVNATAEPLGATWNQQVLSRAVRATESSPFVQVPSGRAQVELTSPAHDTLLARSTLEAVAGAHTSLLVTPGARLTPIVHGFAAPRDPSIRARVVHTADQALTATLATHQLALVPGGDSGPEGLELAASLAATLRVESAAGSANFTVPALPSRSEVLLVVVQTATGLSVLGVAPSAVLGFLPSGGAP
jgi:hypothetical protein